MTAIEKLIELMRHLRHPEHGCPWDRKQEMANIVPYTIEEAYEVADAIENGTTTEVIDELGDLLFQVVFYAQLGKEQGDFDFNSIVEKQVAKLLRRHPHVFPDGTLSSAGRSSGDLDESDVRLRWETMKSQEREEKDKAGVLSHVPVALPALTRANKLQKRAANVGFDWDNKADVIAKVKEEIEELEAAIEDKEKSAIQEELGDLLFSCVNLSRHLSVNPDQALREASKKFEQRFNFVESKVDASGCDWQTFSLQELDELWCQAKRELVASGKLPR